MSKIKYILSVIYYTICGAVCFQFTHFPCDDWENIYTLSYNHHQIRIWTITHCLGLGHETMVCAVCLPIFLCTSYMLYKGIFWFQIPGILYHGQRKVWEKSGNFIWPWVWTPCQAFLPLAHLGCSGFSCPAPFVCPSVCLSAHPSCPGYHSTAHIIKYCSYLGQLLTLEGTWTLLIMGFLCSFSRVQWVKDRSPLATWWQLTFLCYKPIGSSQANKGHKPLEPISMDNQWAVTSGPLFCNCWNHTQTS